MPTPSPSQIQTALTQAFLNKGFTKKSYVDGKLIEDPTALPDQLARLVSALANGDSTWFAQWILSEIVTIPVTSPSGSPSAGFLEP